MTTRLSILTQTLVTLCVAIVAALLLAGCQFMPRTTYANHYQEAKKGSQSPFVAGNGAAQTPMLFPGVKIPELTTDGNADAVGPDGKPIKANGWLVQNGVFTRSTEADVAATLQALKNLEGSSTEALTPTNQRGGSVNDTTGGNPAPTNSPTKTIPVAPALSTGAPATTSMGPVGGGGLTDADRELMRQFIEAQKAAKAPVPAPAPAPAAPAPTPAPDAPAAPPVSLLAPLPGLAPTSATAKNGSRAARPPEDTAAIDYHHPAKHPGGHVLKGGVWEACPGPDCKYNGTVMPDDYLHTDPSEPITPANLARMK